MHVRDLKGMRYLARLLAHPGQEFHVLDLVAAESPAHPSADSSSAGVISRTALGDAGEMLDDRAKSASEDASPRSKLTLSRHAHSATPIGRRRPHSNVTSSAGSCHALSASAVATEEPGQPPNVLELPSPGQPHAIANIARHDRELGAHLDSATRTGTYCAYAPDTPSATSWPQRVPTPAA